jgi:hypothetical protein
MLQSLEFPGQQRTEFVDLSGLEVMFGNDNEFRGRQVEKIELVVLAELFERGPLHFAAGVWPLNSNGIFIEKQLAFVVACA